MVVRAIEILFLILLHFQPHSLSHSEQRVFLGFQEHQSTDRLGSLAQQVLFVVRVMSSIRAHGSSDKKSRSVFHAFISQSLSMLVQRKF